MASKKISINNTFKILEDYYIPSTLRNHIYSVAKIATIISNKYYTKKLITKEQKYQIIIAALLHDLMKLTEVKDFYTKYAKEKTTTQKALQFWEEKRKKYKTIKNEIHEKAAYEELKEKYPKIAIIIKSHAFTNINNLKSIEEKITFYSDKLDEWGTIMPVGKRMILAHLRYTNKIKTKNDWIKILNIDKKIFELEEEILNPINTKPYECEKLNQISINKLFEQLNIDLNLKV